MTNLTNPNEKDTIIANMIIQGMTFTAIKALMKCGSDRISRVKKQVEQFGFVVSSPAMGQPRKARHC